MVDRFPETSAPIAVYIFYYTRSVSMGRRVAKHPVYIYIYIYMISDMFVNDLIENDESEMLKNACFVLA